MEVTVPTTLNVLNGTDARLACTFNSCYTVNHKQFSLNWTYQECTNCSEEMVSPGIEVGLGEESGPVGGPQWEAYLSRTLPHTRPGAQSIWVGCLIQRALSGGVLSCLGGPGEGGEDLEVTASLPGKRCMGEGASCSPCSSLLIHPPHPVPCPPQFLQFRMKIINLKLERFRDRVEFSGNPSKYDVSVTLKNVQLEDEGLYNCYIMNPPDRHRGHGKIYLQVLMEGERQVGRMGSKAAVGAPDPSH